MQLPRGTFREIRKGEIIDSLLQNLEKTKFTGICSISSGAGTGTLVYKAGNCILVKYLGKSGDSGWNELMNNSGEEVDAALSTLDEAQVALSLEFNKACRIIKPQKKESMPKQSVEPAREQPRKPAPPAHAAASGVRVPQKPPAPSSLFQRHAPSAQEPPAAPDEDQRRVVAGFGRPSMPAPPSAPVQHPVKTLQPEKEHTADDQDADQKEVFEKDIDSFDSIDLDNVTDKIRNDCKTMIKQLHLEHLMER